LRVLPGKPPAGKRFKVVCLEPALARAPDVPTRERARAQALLEESLRLYQELDLVVLQDANDPRQHKRYWLEVDLAVEIVSDDDPERDTKVKRVDYAEAGIPEYWLVNPLDETVTVLVLASDAYAEHGIFRRGEHAVSKLLEGFGVDVDEVFNAK
jgi:Uma2 family endonuclease